MQTYSELTKAQQKQVQTETGYSHQELKTEDNPLVPKHSFEEYAADLAEDLGLIEDADSWPMTCIDWEWAARELANDYNSVTIDGQDYYMRAF